MAKRRAMPKPPGHRSAAPLAIAAEGKDRGTEHRGRRDAEDDTGCSAAASPPPDGILDERVRHARQEECSNQQSELDGERELVAHVLIGKDQHGPVPEVEGIRAIPDDTERPQREQARDRQPRGPSSDPGRDRQRGAHRGQQRRKTWERRPLGEQDSGKADRQQPGPAHDEPAHRRHASERRRPDGECGAKPKLPRACERREVRRSRQRRREMDGPAE